MVMGWDEAKISCQDRKRRCILTSTTKVTVEQTLSCEFTEFSAKRTVKRKAKHSYPRIIYKMSKSYEDEDAIAELSSSTFPQ